MIMKMKFTTKNNNLFVWDFLKEEGRYETQDGKLFRKAEWSEFLPFWNDRTIPYKLEDMTPKRAIDGEMPAWMREIVRCYIQPGHNPTDAPGCDIMHTVLSGPGSQAQYNDITEGFGLSRMYLLPAGYRWSRPEFAGIHTDCPIMEQLVKEGYAVRLPYPGCLGCEYLMIHTLYWNMSEVIAGLIMSDDTIKIYSRPFRRVMNNDLGSNIDPTLNIKWAQAWYSRNSCC